MRLLFFQKNWQYFEHSVRNVPRISKAESTYNISWNFEIWYSSLSKVSTTIAKWGFFIQGFFANYISQIDFWGMHSMSDAFWTKKKKMQYLYYVIEHACTPWLIGSKSQTLQIDMKRRADLYISLNHNH